MSYCDIKTIGIPRALLWHKYGRHWQAFFELLGFKVIVSEPTDKAIFDEGERRSSDEVCLASKTYLGHVAQLIGKCDAIFVPNHDSCDVRAGFCTKYQSLPDMVAATFRDDHPRILTLRIERAMDHKRTRKAYMEFAKRELGASPKDAASAYRKSMAFLRALDKKAANHQEETFRLLSTYKNVLEKDESGVAEPPLAILLVGHPYVTHDDYIIGDIVRAIEDMGAVVIYADESDHAAAFKRSFEFSETLPWIINRELVGSILNNMDRIDGIVLLSAFPCGPDSMFDDAVMRRIKDVPILNLMIDSQSGEAGVQTRLESFIDILRFQGKGSYLADDAQALYGAEGEGGPSGVTAAKGGEQDAA